MEHDEKSTNPPAFPIPGMDMQSVGMSLRDYFAAKAVQGILSNEKMTKLCAKKAVSTNSGWESIMSNNAYSIADAMLTERQK